MVATLSGESGQNLNTAPLQGNDARFGGGNGIANWSSSRWNALGRPQGLDNQLAGVAKEIRSGANRTSMGNAADLVRSGADPNALSTALTGSASSGLGYERPLYPDTVRYRNAPPVESYQRLAGSQSGGPLGAVFASLAPSAAGASPAGDGATPSGLAPLPATTPSSITPPGISPSIELKDDPGSAPPPLNIGDLLAGIADGLRQPAGLQPRLQALVSGQEQMKRRAPDIGALLYGTHPDLVLT